MILTKIRLASAARSSAVIDRHKWLIPLCAALIACPVSAALWDIPIAAVMRSLHGTELMQLSQRVTDYANAGWYLGGSALMFGFSFMIRPLRRLRHRSGYIFLSVGLASILSEAVAYMAGRARPRLFFELDVFGFFGPPGFKPYDSFPSSHATSVLAFAFAAGLAFPKLRGLFWIYGLALAGTRIVLGAHFLSDVLASAAIAGSTALALSMVFREIKEE